MRCLLHCARRRNTWRRPRSRRCRRPAGTPVEGTRRSRLPRLCAGRHASSLPRHVVGLHVLARRWRGCGPTGWHGLHRLRLWWQLRRCFWSNGGPVALPPALRHWLSCRPLRVRGPRNLGQAGNRRHRARTAWRRGARLGAERPRGPRRTCRLALRLRRAARGTELKALRLPLARALHLVGAQGSRRHRLARCHLRRRQHRDGAGNVAVAVARARRPQQLRMGVQAIQIAGAGAVGGAVVLAWCQRHPAHGRHLLRALVHLELRPTGPGHQRRGVHRARHAWPRRPAPASAPGHPSPVVKRRKAPGRVVDPGPAPGAQPDPLPVTVRHPADGHRGRRPHRAVFGVLLPAAKAVEVLDTGHLGRNEGRRGAARIGLVGQQHELREGVVQRRQHLAARHALRPVAPELGALTRLQGQ